MIKCRKCKNKFDSKLKECPYCNGYVQPAHTSERPVNAFPLPTNQFNESSQETTSRRERPTDTKSDIIPQPRFRILSHAPAQILSAFIIVIIVIILSYSSTHDIRLPISSANKSATISPTTTGVASGKPVVVQPTQPRVVPGNPTAVPPIQAGVSPTQPAVVSATQPKISPTKPAVAVPPTSKGKDSSRVTNLRLTDNPIVQTSFHPTPVSIVQGDDGNLWFTDDANEIGKVTPQGVITEVPLMNGIGSGPAYPSHIINGPDKNLWFTMSGKPYIGKFNTNTGSFTYFNLSAQEEQEEGGTGITIGPDGNLWYVLAGNSATTRKAKIGCITVTGASCGKYNLGIGVNPSSIISAGGKLWFTEFDNDSIGWLIPGPNATPHIISLPGIQPFNMVSGPNGEIWFTEPNVGRLGHVNADGSHFVEVPLTNLVPESIASGPDGTLWFTAWNHRPGGPGGSIERLSPDGTITSYSLPTPCYPTHNGNEYDNGNGITVASNGQIWFTEDADKTATPKIGHSL